MGTGYYPLCEVYRYPFAASIAIMKRSAPRLPGIAVWCLLLTASLPGMVRATQSDPLMAADVQVLSAAMVSRKIFRVQVRHTGPIPAPLTVTAPFPGMAEGAVVTVPAVVPNVPATINYDLETLKVPRFRKTLRLRVAAALGGAVPATGSREAVIPLPVVTVLGIDPGAAFLGKPSNYRAVTLEDSLVRQSAAAWGAQNGYQVYGLPPKLLEGSQDNEEWLAGADAGASAPLLDRYVSVFPFRWDANTGRLSEELDDLERFIRLRVFANTWADQVVLLCHSRGANLARAYLTRYAAPDGTHPQCAAAVLACMPATGSPWAMFWRRFGVSRARGFPKGWYDTLPTYPWYRDYREPSENPLPFRYPERDDQALENRTLKELNARSRPAGVEIQLIYGRTNERDTLVAFTDQKLKVRSVLRNLVGAGKGDVDPSQFGPMEYGDFIVSAYSARGVELVIDPKKDEVKGGAVVPWLKGAPTKEFIFERPFKEVGGMHVGFLAEEQVQTYLFDWLNHHQVQEIPPVAPPEGVPVAPTAGPAAG